MLNNSTKNYLVKFFTSSFFRDSISFLPTVIPITFYKGTKGAELCHALTKYEYIRGSNFQIPVSFTNLEANGIEIAKGLHNLLGDFFMDSVWYHRNYDGSETYILITDFSEIQIQKFSQFVKDSKGGVLYA